MIAKEKKTKEIMTTESVLGKQVNYRGEEYRSHVLYIKKMGNF